MEKEWEENKSYFEMSWNKDIAWGKNAKGKFEHIPSF